MIYETCNISLCVVWMKWNRSSSAEWSQCRTCLLFRTCLMWHFCIKYIFQNVPPSASCWIRVLPWILMHSGMFFMPTVVLALKYQEGLFSSIRPPKYRYEELFQRMNTHLQCIDMKCNDWRHRVKCNKAWINSVICQTVAPVINMHMYVVIVCDNDSMYHWHN